MYLFSGLSKILVILFRVLVVLTVLILVTVNGFTVSAETQTDSNEPTTNTLSTIFPACKFADTGVASFLECGSQITFFILVVAIIYAFLKLAYMAINGLLFAGGVSSDFYKMIGESLRNLVVGILFVGMPVTILTAIDPLAGIINFRFLEELNLGPEARLIEPGEEGVGGRGKGCNDFMYCVVACSNSSNRSTCVDTCKNRYSRCQSCFQFVNDQGEIIDKKGFQECIVPSPSIPSEEVGGGNLNPSIPSEEVGGGNLDYEGSILSCGNNQATIDSNGFVRLAYTPYISQNKQPDGQKPPAPDKYRNSGCGGASSLMIVEMARPGTFPCLDNQKLRNFSGDQDHYCLYTYFWQNANYRFVVMDPINRDSLINNTNSSCQGAFGITSMKNCNQSYHAGRRKFLGFFGLTTEPVGSSAQYFQAIKDNINQGLPLFISINFTPQLSHIMVIVGYKEETRQILLNDPWQYDNTWGSSRLMVVTLNQNNTGISGYRYSRYPTPSIGYIEKVRKMSGFAPVQCNLA